MKVLILAAGYATRLWPLTLNRPKPLLPIRRKPIVEYIIEKLAAVKTIDDIFIITNTKFVSHFERWKRSYTGGHRISVIDDGMDRLQKRLGSIGDILFAIEKKKIESDILVIAGDNIFSSALDGFIGYGQSRHPYAAIGLYDIKDPTLASKYGIVQLNNDSRILSFEEKPKNSKSTLAAMCLYYFPKEKIGLIKKYRDEGNPLDLAGCFIKWLSEKEAVYGYIFTGEWLDIGDARSLRRAQAISWAGA